MTDGLLAVELNDAGIALARATPEPRLVGTPSPGIALLLDGEVVTGEVAASRHRVAPLHVQNRYWYALGTEPLPWTARGIATAADLAHAHLSALLAEPVRDGAGQLLLAVPPGYSREQLGLLIGIANECGIVVRGLVDQGLAGCATLPPVPHMLHLDLHQHQATATLVEVARTESMLRRARYELLPGCGLLAFQQALVQSIATAFVRETRFDPLYEAGAEQRLYDCLPQWLQDLAEADEIPAEFEWASLTHRIVLRRAQVEHAVAALSDEVLRLVQLARPAGTALQVCVTPRIAAVPGLLARLANLRDCVVVELPQGAAALGALQFASAIVRPADAIALVHRLPLTAGAAVEFAAAAAGPVVVPTEDVPTHVLYQGRAWPVTAVPLVLGWSVTAGSRALSVPAGIAGVSRSHCTLQAQDGLAFVTDHSTYGTFVNDERVGGRLALRVGDVLRLGAPGVTLELIRVLPDHGDTP
jgi:hypothetical protein